MATTVVTAKFVADTSNFNDKLKDANDQLGGMGDRMGGLQEKLGGFQKSFTETGKKLTLGVTTPLVGLGAASVLAFSSVEKGVAEIGKATGATGKDLEDFGQSFRSVLRQVPEDAIAVGQAMGDLNTRVGATGEELEELTKTALDFARVNNEDVGRSTEVVGKLLNALELDASNAEQVMDKLTFAAQKTGISATTLGQHILDAGPAFEELGFGIDESIALFGAFEQAGARPEEVIGSLNKAINTMAKDAGKLDELERGLIKPAEMFDEFLVQIKEAPDILAATTLASELFGARVGAKVAEDIRAGRFEISDFADEIAGVQGVVSDTAKATQTFDDRMAILKNQTMLAAASFGEILIPVIERVVGIFQGFVQRLNELSPRQRELIVTIAAVAAAVGPVLLVVGKLIGLFLGTIGVIVKVVAIMVKLVAGIKIAIGVIGAIISILKILGMVMIAALGPIGLIIAGVVALIAILVALYKNNETVRRIIDQVWQAIQRIFRAVLDWIVSYLRKSWENLQRATQMAMDFIRKAIEVVWNVIKTLFNLTPIGLVIRHWDTLKNATQTAFRAIQRAVQVFIDFFRRLPKIVFDLLSKVLSFYRELPGRILSALKGAGRALFSVGRDLVQGLLDGAGSLLRNVGNFFVDMLPGWIQGPFKRALGISSPSKVFAGFGRDIIDGLVQGLESGEGLTKEAVRKTIIDKFTETRDQLRQVVKDIEQDMESMARSVSDSIMRVIDFGAAASESGEGGEEVGKSFIERLTDQANRAIEFSERLTTLLDMGLKGAAFDQVYNQSADNGIKIADELIAGGSEAIDETMRLINSAQQAADKVGQQAANNFYGAGLKSAQETQKAFVDHFGPGGPGRARLNSLMDRLARSLDRTSIVTVVTRHVSEGIPGRRFGGPVAAGSPYIVGEAGPELFVPTMSGQIIPNNRMGHRMPTGGVSMGGHGGTVINVNISAPPLTDPAEVGRQAVEAIRKYERRSGPVFVSA